ncbi:MAG: Gfo/Idh/MocA family oxidoreductase [Candidatus Latescibacteria bacterium]|jgi:predicted dehydrogenase|nr:Gfo/Idh/MocA family oxidoreductase [Candidatus Latescibacterota bacterium]
MTGEKKRPDRRKFLGAAGMTAFAAAASPLMRTDNAQARTSGGKLRVALVGTGIRGSGLWGKTLYEKYGDVVEFVGLCDINTVRMEFVKQYMGVKCPTFTDFDEMVKKTKPDTVIVTTMDCFHAKYICRAMELGCDVITEKPMATDEKMCQDIIDTEKRTGRHVRVTFNYRYGPAAVRIKEILMSGEIGQVTSVDFSYFLDTSHGASYFRRWHAFKQKSGSLLVHKSTHHFDLMNWWLNAEPVEVNACGKLRHYGWNSPFRGERCMNCGHKSSCPYYWDITKNEFLMNLYVKPESEDGYMRDACLFRRKINIWDTMSAQVRYHNDVLMNYSLNACMPYEGFNVGFNGTKGRLDAREYHRQPWDVKGLADIRISLNFKNSREITIGAGGSSHWGADERMQDMIFKGPIPDPLGQTAGSRAGALSIMIGIAARRSIERQRPVVIEELVKI